jgi:hypothetical protein
MDMDDRHASPAPCSARLAGIFNAHQNAKRSIASRMSAACSRITTRRAKVLGQIVAAKSAQQSHVVKHLFTGSAFLNRKAARDVTRFTFRSN